MGALTKIHALSHELITPATTSGVLLLAPDMRRAGTRVQSVPTCLKSLCVIALSNVAARWFYLRNLLIRSDADTTKQTHSIANSTLRI